jgi:hypothetical protein
VGFSSSITRVLLILMLMSSAVIAAAYPSRHTAISTDSLDRPGGAELLSCALYSTNDDPAFADPAYDDSQWMGIQEVIGKFGVTVDSWDGSGWFRMRFRLRPESRNKSIALRMWHVGASEVYVDGIRIASFGSINIADPLQMQGYVPQFEFVSVDPALTTREPNVDHVIAIRFQSSPFVPAEMIGGYKNVVPLSVWIGRTQELTQYYGAFRAQYDIRILIPLGLVVALGLLHLFAYVFDRRSTVNLYYVAYAFTFASIVTCWTIIEVSTDPEIVFWSGFLINVLWTVVDVAAVYLVTKLLQGAVRGWRAWTFPALAVIVWTAPMMIPIGGNTLWGFFTLVCFVDILVQVIGALRRRHEAAVFIGIGMTLFFVYVLTWFFGFYLEMVAIDRTVWRVIFIAASQGSRS